MTVTAEKPQNLIALDNANRIRLARADLKRAIKNGDVQIAEILEADIPDWLEKMPVLQLFEAVPRLGVKTAYGMLQGADLGPLREVGWITARQRILLSMMAADWQARQRARATGRRAAA